MLTAADLQPCLVESVGDAGFSSNEGILERWRDGVVQELWLEADMVAGHIATLELYAGLRVPEAGRVVGAWRGLTVADIAGTGLWLEPVDVACESGIDPVWVVEVGDTAAGLVDRLRASIVRLEATIFAAATDVESVALLAKRGVLRFDIVVKMALFGLAGWCADARKMSDLWVERNAALAARDAGASYAADREQRHDELTRALEWLRGICPDE